MGLPELIGGVKKVDDNTVQFVLTRPGTQFLADLAMDFASILSKEYADAMMKTRYTGKTGPQPNRNGSVPVSAVSKRFPYPLQSV